MEVVLEVLLVLYDFDFEFINWFKDEYLINLG